MGHDIRLYEVFDCGILDGHIRLGIKEVIRVCWVFSYQYIYGFSYIDRLSIQNCLFRYKYKSRQVVKYSQQIVFAKWWLWFSIEGKLHVWVDLSSILPTRIDVDLRQGCTVLIGVPLPGVSWWVPHAKNLEMR